MSAPLRIAILGDLHGAFDGAIDGPALAGFALRLCTGDLAPNAGKTRFEEAERQAADLAAHGVLTILGNHDGPTAFTGRSFPKSYLRLCAALGEAHVGMRRIEMPELGLTLVGARPLSTGGSELRFLPPGTESWTIEQWGEAITELILAAEGERIVVLAHDGPTGLGATRESIYGCDFRADQGDWGDRDLRLALDRALDAGKPIVAVVAGHMHHALRGGGERTWQVRERGMLHVNAALVPRVTPRGRALVVLEIDGLEASARIEWTMGATPS
jgi:uncharacterized protein (TIGR04168 family)